MKPYMAVLVIRMKALFQYRAAALAGLATQTFWAMVKMMILQAFYAHSTGGQPISLHQGIMFIWLGQAFLGLIPFSFDKDIEAQIRTGNVAYELVRPIDLYGTWFFKSLGLRLIPTTMRSIPLLIVAVCIFDFSPPASAASCIAVFVSLIFSLLLSSAITTMAMTTMFWTLSGEGILRLLPHLAMLLSGMVVPLPLFPSWLQPLVSLQPFRGIVDIPIRLYMGLIPSHEMIYYLGFQVVWTVIFIWLGRALIQKALKQLVIQGG